MGQPTFVLGLGAQKSGTTWLHGYLKSMAGFHAGAAKEYHIWDALLLGSHSGFKQPPAQDNAPFRDKLRARMQAEPWFYFKYFQDILNRPGVGMTADFTPTYAALPVKALRRIHAGFQRRDIACKTVFLMRDPVERCWSAIRGRVQRNRTDPAQAEAILLDYAQGPRAQALTNYQFTVENMHAALPKGDIHIGRYETLFTPAGLSRVSRFLGVAPDHSQTEVRRNMGRALPLSEGTRAKVARMYRDTYTYCGNHFPDTLELWQGFKYL